MRVAPESQIPALKFLLWMTIIKVMNATENRPGIIAVRSNTVTADIGMNLN